MNKLYLLVSCLLLTTLVITTYDGSEVKSYTNGDVTLRVHCNSDGAVKKREYVVSGIVRRVIEYGPDNTKLETIYDTNGKKQTVHKYIDNQIIKSINYSNGIYAGTNELSLDPVIEI